MNDLNEIYSKRFKKKEKNICLYQQKKKESIFRKVRIFKKKNKINTTLCVNEDEITR